MCWLARSAAPSSAFGRAEFLRCRGVHAALAAAEPALARERLTRVADVIHASGIPFVMAEGLLLAGRIAVLEGDAGAAADAQRGAAETAATFGTPWYLAGAANLAGRVAALAGDAGAAEDAYQEALALCARHSFTGAGAEALERIASLAAQGASMAEAARLFGAAAALRERSGWARTADDQYGYDADLSLLQDALSGETVADLWEQGRELDLAGAAAYARRARGERKRPPTGWGSLTPTELAVVDLVAQGLSNAAIAERMFFTTGTAKSHLHHIFAKLAVANRTQLAAVALGRRAERPKI